MNTNPSPNWRNFLLFLLAAILLSIAIGLWHPVSAYYYVEQGDFLYVNDTVDISGVAAGILNLAYYGINSEENLDTQYLLKLPKNKSGYYAFYLDPKIFGNRIGTWYKWNGEIESNGNTVAFKIRPQRQAVNASGATVNVSPPVSNQSGKEPPRIPILPLRTVADYLVARGNSLKISSPDAISVWIFGARDMLLDYHAYNKSVDIPANEINALSPGRYTILLQEKEPGYSGDSAIRYDNVSNSIQWFDEVTFTVQRFNMDDQTPDNILAKLKSVFPVTHNRYQLFSLEVEEPTISIDEINAVNQLNYTGAPQAEGLIMGAASYVIVKGYTNVEPDTLIQVVVDADFNQPGDLVWKDAIVTASQGEPGGIMRDWKVLVPLDLYNMPSCGTGKCEHFVSARTGLSDAVISTAPFYIYENPEGNAIPNKTMRYISGRYGPEELVPTPTPITVTHEITRVVTQVVTVPVTPSNEQVLVQQRIAQKEISEQNWNKTVSYIGIGIFAIIFIAVGIWIYSAWRRSKT
ncbi:MAG: DUF3821 domain-containing protein [Methanoregula sp.]|jgi:hypothetical protein|nr:DUF3821 domain-containing protein [Methanoregula sp.]